MIDGSGSVATGTAYLIPGRNYLSPVYDFEYNWNLILDFVLLLAKNIGISENGTRMAVVVFSEYAKLEIKFSDHQNYESFQKAVLAIDHPRSSTATLNGFEVALNEMFNEKTGMRSSEVPKNLIYLTDGQCLTEECDTSLPNFPDECLNLPRKCDMGTKQEDLCFPFMNCNDQKFKEWARRFETRQIRKTGIGIGLDGLGSAIDAETQITSFVGEKNFDRKDNFNEILTKQFRRSLSLCDGE